MKKVLMENEKEGVCMFRIICLYEMIIINLLL